MRETRRPAPGGLDPGAPRGPRQGRRAAPARSRLTLRLGATFTARRAREAGLEWRDAFHRLLALDVGLDPIRLGAAWDEVERDGWESLDWLLDQAGLAGRRVVLVAGMKAPGWPEFQLPPAQRPGVVRRGSDVAAAAPPLAAAAAAFVESVVARHRGHRAVACWQVENEPFNPAGPERWWIGPEAVRREVEVVRRLDPDRPLALNVFGHFDRGLDAASRTEPAFRAALGLLEAGDVLGVDAYLRIGHRLAGRPRVAGAGPSWDRHLARWREAAETAGLEPWVMEAQAEPWEPEPAAPRDEPRSFRPAELEPLVRRLAGAGYGTVLLWGCEHWLARSGAGDESWLDAVRALRGLRRP